MEIARLCYPEVMFEQKALRGFFLHILSPTPYNHFFNEVMILKFTSRSQDQKRYKTIR